MNGRQFLQEQDDGRTRRGLLVMIGCSIVWAVLIWLAVRLL